jgi:hypothetical protein
MPVLVLILVVASRWPWYGDVIDASASGEPLPLRLDDTAGGGAAPSVFIHRLLASAYADWGGGISDAYGGDDGLYAAESPGTPGMLEEGMLVEEGMLEDAGW